MKTVVKYALVAFLLFSWSFLSLMVFGEESPNSNLTQFQFWFMKMGACALVYILYLFTRFCYKQGFFPEIVNEFIEKTESEDI